MYKEYWGLIDRPFENVSDVKSFYRSLQHEEALMRMLYVAKEEKGCGLLTGKYGTGKSFVMYALMNELNNLGRETVLLPNPSFDSLGILKDFCYRLGIKVDGKDKSDMLHILEENLLSYAREGKSAVIIVDEAHTLENKEALEDLRMFLNLNYMGKFLVTLIFSGQIEFLKILKTVPQLDQRIALKYTLKGMSKEETFDYILFRLSLVGCKKQIFDDDAVELIWSYSEGAPRAINNICDIALLFGSYEKATHISKKIIEEAQQSLEGNVMPSSVESVQQSPIKTKDNPPVNNNKEVQIEDLEKLLLIKKYGSTK